MSFIPFWAYFWTKIKSWLSRCAHTWRTRHSKPTCRHEHGHAHFVPKACAWCGMLDPDHDKGCVEKEHWSGKHHYAVWCEAIKAYTSCCLGREWLADDQQNPTTNKLVPIDESDCPVCLEIG